MEDITNKIKFYQLISDMDETQLLEIEKIALEIKARQFFGVGSGLPGSRAPETPLPKTPA